MPKEDNKQVKAPRGGAGKKPAEKPKNFKEAVTKLIKSLKDYKVLVIISLILAGVSAFLSLVSPNRLSDLTDEISKGLVINTKNMTLLQEDLLSNVNEDKMGETFSSILGLNMSPEKMMSLSNEDRIMLQSTLVKIKEEPKNSLKYLGELPDTTLNNILDETTYKDIVVSKEDKINLIKLLKDIDVTVADYSYIGKMPISINKILFPDSKISGVEISTEDKVKFLNTMSTISKDTEVSEMYKKVETLPDNIQKLINPTMDKKAIKSIAIFLAVLYILSALFNYIEGLIMLLVANRYAKGMRTKISEKINRLPLKFFDNNLSGDILSRVTNDVDTISQSLNQSLATLVSSLTLFIGSIIMMFKTNYIMAITAILASLIGFGIMFLILGKSQKYFSKRQVELGKLNGYIEEVYSGLNVVKTCNAEEETYEEFNKLNNNLYDCNQKSQFLSGLMPPIMGFVGNLGYVAVCIVGSLLVSKDMVSFGVIVAFIMYVRLFTSPLSQIASSMTSLQSSAAASERVFEFLEEPEMEKETNKKHLNKKKVKGKIEFQNIKFGYKEDRLIINNFTEVARPGQKIAIVGPTGAGKTTIVNLLMKFYDINEGDIKIDGVSIKDLTRENIHSLFTMVLQDTWLFDGTIKENIIYNRKNITDKKVEEVCKTVGVDHFIKTLPNGYDSKITGVDSVSQGQKQLMTIARGMIEDAPFLILDEATSNVDTRTEILVQKAMDKLMENKTSFIIAHRLSTIKNADLILVMKDGSIIESGNHKELMKLGGFYKDLYNSQFESIN